MDTARATAKGHVIIPAHLRRKYNIRKGSLVAVYEGKDGTIVVKPLPDDPVESSKGMLKGGPSILQGLLLDRKEEGGRG